MASLRTACPDAMGKTPGAQDRFQRSALDAHKKSATAPMTHTSILLVGLGLAEPPTNQVLLHHLPRLARRPEASETRQGVAAIPTIAHKDHLLDLDGPRTRRRCHTASHALLGYRQHHVVFTAPTLGFFAGTLSDDYVGLVKSTGGCEVAAPDFAAVQGDDDTAGVVAHSPFDSCFGYVGDRDAVLSEATGADEGILVIRST